MLYQNPRFAGVALTDGVIAELYQRGTIQSLREVARAFWLTDKGDLY